ncbi:hypothetical protein TorRG33x02_310490 [Trema orientale]|uniref:Transmembrane protein n=1 Tax=Trema orientale TaxID=63057 RepID=A0A2P5BSP8_TREOI|nr:hypothetical protein TorRG33x02_310490 [Trema orientale]
MMKDTLECAREPNLNLKGFLQNAYVHPVFKGGDDGESDVVSVEDLKEEPTIVPTKHQSQRNTPLPSKQSGSLISQDSFIDSMLFFSKLNFALIIYPLIIIIIFDKMS